jgi:hypothetical protein
VTLAQPGLGRPMLGRITGFSSDPITQNSPPRLERRPQVRPRCADASGVRWSIADETSTRFASCSIGAGGLSGNAWAELDRYPRVAITWT